MIFNNYRKMQRLEGEGERSFTLELLVEWHSTLTEDNYGEVLFVPPPANGLEEELQLLCDFANREEASFIHPLVKAMILHLRLAYLHPFVDGNGRMTRTLFYWVALRSGYWVFEFLSISRIILSHVGQYGRAYLYTELDEADLTYFLVFRSRVIAKAFAELEGQLKEEEELLKYVLVETADIPDLNLRQSKLLTHALNHPHAVYRIQPHRTMHEVSYETARNDLVDLTKRELVQKSRKGAAVPLYCT